MGAFWGKLQKMKILFLKGLLMSCRILFTFYAHQSLKHNKCNLLETTLILQQTLLIKYCIFFIAGTHLKKHIYDCQIRLHNGFSAEYVLPVKLCDPWKTEEK